MKTVAPRQAESPEAIEMETVALAPMANWLALPALFGATLRNLCRFRRLSILVLLYLLPAALVVLVRSLAPNFEAESERPFYMLEFVTVLIFLPTVVVPLTALLFSSGIIQDEIEDQTLTYLLVRPIPKSGIYLMKWLAAVAVAIALMSVFTTLAEAVLWFGANLLTPAEWAKRVSGIVVAQAWALLAYSAIFGFVSLIFKKTLIIGAGYILLFEGVLANIPFVIREYTIMYYTRVQWLRTLAWPDRVLQDVKRTWAIDLETAPSVNGAVATLLVITAIFLLLACYLMVTREFRVKTPEGS